MRIRLLPMVQCTFYFLIPVLHCLCYVGEFVSLVDVKSTAEIWKCISRLGTESSSYVVAEGVSIPWLQNAVEFLCNEIVQSVTIILDNLNEVCCTWFSFYQDNYKRSYSHRMMLSFWQSLKGFSK